jgi:amino acid transporter
MPFRFTSLDYHNKTRRKMVVKTIKYKNVRRNLNIAYGMAVVISLMSMSGGLLLGVMTWITLFLIISIAGYLYRRKYIYPNAGDEGLLHRLKDDVMATLFIWYIAGTVIGSVAGYFYFIFSYSPYNVTFGAIAVLLGIVLFFLIIPFGIIGGFLMEHMVEPYESESEKIWRRQRRRAILWGFAIAISIGIAMAFVSKALSKDKE